MYPEFIPIYIGLAIIIILLIVILCLIIFRKPSNMSKNTSAGMGYRAMNTGRGIVFCQKCATQFDGSQQACPKCGTIR